MLVVCAANMKHLRSNVREPSILVLVWSAFFIATFGLIAGDNASLLSMSVTNNTPMMPRTIFTETWTFQNTGTTTWTPGSGGYTLNLLGKDKLGAIQLYTNNSSTRYIPSATIASGKSIAPGGTASFSIMFIAPETPGLVSDTFQLNGTTNFGPIFTNTINVIKAGSTNQYDRSKAISYANNYAGYVVTDGYFWTNGSGYYNYGAGAPVPTAFLGDDCAHFVSCCIGVQSQSNRGGGISIYSRASPTYGEPGAGRLINTVLIEPGYAKEVSSISQMAPGDVIGWNWEGDTNITNLDHVTLYLGNGLVASHAQSALDVSTGYFKNSSSHSVMHLVHIFDAPTLGMTRTNKQLTFTWTTNWAGYGIYFSQSMATNATWNKLTATVTHSGATNKVTLTAPPVTTFYRLQMP
jgi:hypothetical protein